MRSPKIITLFLFILICFFLNQIDAVAGDLSNTKASVREALNADELLCAQINEVRDRAENILKIKPEDMIEAPKIIHLVWVGDSPLSKIEYDTILSYLMFTSEQWKINIWSDQPHKIIKGFNSYIETKSGELDAISRLKVRSVEQLIDQFLDVTTPSTQSFLDMEEISFDKNKVIIALHRELIGFGEPRAAADIVRYMALYMEGGYAMNLDQRPLKKFCSSDVINKKFKALIQNQGRILKVMLGVPHSPVFAKTLHVLDEFYKNDLPIQSTDSQKKRNPLRSEERAILTTMNSGSALATAVQRLKIVGLLLKSQHIRQWADHTTLLGTELELLTVTKGASKIFLGGSPFELKLETKKAYLFLTGKIHSNDDSQSTMSTHLMRNLQEKDALDDVGYPSDNIKIDDFLLNVRESDIDNFVNRELIAAMVNENWKKVKSIIENTTDPLDKLDGAYLLNFAWDKERFDVITHAIKKLPHLACFPLDLEGNNLAHYAVMSGHIGMFKLLLDQIPFSIRSKNSFNYSPLFKGVVNGQNKIIEIVSKSAPHLLIEENFFLPTLAHGAALIDDPEILEILALNYPSIMSIGDNKRGFTPAHLVAHEQYWDLLPLIARLAPVTFTQLDKQGKTPLSLAGEKGASPEYLQEIENILMGK